jgi:hypothetical protein
MLCFSSEAFTQVCRHDRGVCCAHAVTHRATHAPPQDREEIG